MKKKFLKNQFMLQQQKIMLLLNVHLNGMLVILKKFYRLQIIFLKKMVELIYLGFRSALTRVINKYSNDRNNKKNKINLSGEDIKEGLTAVLSIKMPDPKFSSQTKDKLVSSEIRNIVENIIGVKKFQLGLIKIHQLQKLF